MNGDRASQQFERIQAMLEQSGSDCTIERHVGELDSVHLTFHCGGQRRSVAWVGERLETLSDDDLWREIDLATMGYVKKPDEGSP